MHNIWSSGVTHVCLSTDYLDLARKQWWWLVVEVEWIARSTVDRSFASVSLTQIQHLLDKNHVWKFCFHPVHLWVVLRYHRAHRRSLENKKSYISIQTLIFKTAMKTRRSSSRKISKNHKRLSSMLPQKLGFVLQNNY